MAFELVAYEALKDLLGLDSDKISQYPPLKIIKDSVEAALEIESGREFEQRERTKTQQSSEAGLNRIYLEGLPVVSVASVTVDGEALASDDYTITAGGLRFAQTHSDAEIVVVYTGGFTQATLRPEIERAALLQTCYEYQNKDHIGASSVTTEGGSVNVPALQLLPVVKKLINKFKHPWLGVHGL